MTHFIISDGQALQIGEGITVTVLEVDEDTILFRIDGADESDIELGAELVGESSWQLS